MTTTTLSIYKTPLPCQRDWKSNMKKWNSSFKSSSFRFIIVLLVPFASKLFKNYISWRLHENRHFDAFEAKPNRKLNILGSSNMSRLFDQFGRKKYQTKCYLMEYKFFVRFFSKNILFYLKTRPSNICLSYNVIISL